MVLDAKILWIKNKMPQFVSMSRFAPGYPKAPLPLF